MEVTGLIKNKIHSVSNFFEKKSILKNLLVFLFLFCFFALLYIPLNKVVSADDHFFHFKFAEQIRDNGLLQSFHNFDAIYFTKIAQNDDHFIYYNFLFYIVLIPFTFIKPLFIGIKLYAILAASLSFFVLFYVIKKMDIKCPFLIIAGIISITSFAEIWRFLLSRPYTLAPALLLLLIFCLFKKKYIFAFIISFVYLFWHSATFYFPLLILLCYSVSENFYEQKTDFKKIFAVIGGVLFAVITIVLITPGFFTYINDNVLSLFADNFTGEKVNVVEGGEVFPVNFFDYLRSNTLIFILFVSAIIIESSRYFKFRTRRIDREAYLLSSSVDTRIIQTTLFFLSVGFFFGVIAISRRFDDFLVFFVSLYLSIFFFYYLRDIFSGIKKETKKEILGGFFVVMFFLFINNSLFLYERISTGTNPDGFEKIGNWLKDNSKEGKTIFNTEWSWFPQLYFFNPEGKYVAGLEPKLLYIYNSEMYWLWINISKGIICPFESCPTKDLLIKRDIRKGDIDKSKVILNEKQVLNNVLKTVFKSSYIITSNSKDLNQLNMLLDYKEGFKKVFTDGDFMIYEVL